MLLIQKHILKRLIFIVIIGTSNTVFAQHAIFMMSSIGGLSSGVAANATAVQFKSSANCIDVQNGIAVLNGTRALGDFAINCDIKVKFNALGIKMFPNPVSSVAKIKFNNTPPLTEEFKISIWSSTGAFMSSKKETGFNIFQGVFMDMNDLVDGTYVLQIESSTYLDAIKFIKAK